MKFRSIFTASAIALAAAMVPAAKADVVATFQDVTFTMHIVDADTFTLQIVGLLDASGDWADVTQIGALGFKDLGGTWTGGTINPDGSSAVLAELTANGCTGGGTGLCFTFNPLLASDNDDLFTINLVGTGALAFDAANPPHLKVNFNDADGDQIGSLGSADINFGSSTSSSGISSTSSSSGTVPEPNTGGMALLGLGLLAGSFMVRRQTRR